MANIQPTHLRKSVNGLKIVVKSAVLRARNFTLMFPHHMILLDVKVIRFLDSINSSHHHQRGTTRLVPVEKEEGNNLIIIQ